MNGAKHIGIIPMKGNQTPMNAIVHDLGWGVHQETIAVSMAPGDSREVRRYGTETGFPPVSR
jgi:uncharacterized protein YijF (DUF1287 family)